MDGRAELLVRTCVGVSGSNTIKNNQSVQCELRPVLAQGATVQFMSAQLS